MNTAKTLFSRALRSQRVRRAASCAVFLLLLGGVLTGATNLFRNPGPPGYDNLHIVGRRQENVDMVYIGGSAAFIYWQPLNAYHNHGLTSYLYACNTLPAEAIKPLIMESESIQPTPLYVIDARTFLYWSSMRDDAPLHKVADGLDVFSPNRWRMISTYLRLRTDRRETDDPVSSLYFAIGKYHTNLDNLVVPASWESMFNSYRQPAKGWERTLDYVYLDRPQGYETTQTQPLPEGAEWLLTDLLKYCRQKDLNVLFVVCPYVISKEQTAQYNGMRKLIASYGYDLLNMNSDAYYRQMGLDFTTDFYDVNHVNAFGAEKYTDFLANRLMERYGLPDRRGDPAFRSWDADYEQFINDYPYLTDGIQRMIDEVREALDIAKEMSGTEDIVRWYQLATDSRFLLAFSQVGEMDAPESLAEQQILKEWDLLESPDGSVRLIRDGEFLEWTNTGCTNSGVSVGGANGYKKHCSIEKDEQGAAVFTLGEDAFRFDGEGIHVMAVDQNHRCVADRFTLKCRDGKLVIERENAP